ncbi:two-component system response regulator YesN [Anaerotaenia torta]|uniref:response regulator transcription factor n=1 Tax=Anaerotaenia torta TaxID=433293 RepID=UPI003D1E3258
MYKLLIADDEKQTREGIAYFFQNNPCGFEVVGVADGGLTALSMASERTPDLVLTDIRMPDMDGFALCERLAMLSRNPSIIIMSAYDDVEYFKSAFRVNALDYILKPIDTAELKAVVHKVKERLDAENEERLKRERTQKQMKKDLSFLKTRFFIDLVDGTPQDTPDFEEKLQFLAIALPKECRYNTLIVSVDNKQEAYGGMNRSAEKVLDFGMQYLMEELIEIHSNGYAFEYDKGDFVLILYDDSKEESFNPELFEAQVNGLSDAIQSILRKGSNIRATIGIGSYVDQLSQLPKSFEKASENVYKRLILGSDRVIQRHEKEQGNKDLLFKSLDEVRSAISVADPQILYRAIENFYFNLTAAPDLDVVYGIQCSGMLVTAAYEAFSALHSELKLDENEIMNSYEKLRKMETIPDMKRTVLEFCMRLNQVIREKVTDNNSEIIKRIKEIIEREYSENISIQSIADRIFLSPTYLCAVFKQETGQTINQYITHIRIEAAKRMLEDSSVRLADIGCLVGYIEPSYFSKIFKKYTALTPKEYRQMLIGLRRTK